MRDRQTPFLVLLALLLALAACGAGAIPGASTETLGVPASDELSESSSGARSEAAPTPRPELAASDPATVELAAGELQFIEFFAFW